ncbi:hypothetical protein SAMN05443247_01319 [Bradyrhizobium erythrophlei]|nr:hypothetical protein SAMN05443247_01319 [Bradyrhizobium erythrophlei]
MIHLDVTDLKVAGGLEQSDPMEGRSPKVAVAPGLRGLARLEGRDKFAGAAVPAPVHATSCPVNRARGALAPLPARWANAKPADWRAVGSRPQPPKAGARSTSLEPRLIGRSIQRLPLGLCQNFGGGGR